MTQTKISRKLYAIRTDYTQTVQQKSFTVNEETADYSVRKPACFTPWTWTSDCRLVRYPQNSGIIDYDLEQECSEESVLEKQIEIFTQVRQEFVDGSSVGRKKEYLQSIENRDQHLEYLRKRLKSVRATQLLDSNTRSESQPISPASALVIDAEELTEEEQRHRLHLERKVERAFYEAGKALQQLRDTKLYCSTHSTFEEYCKDRFGFERRHPYRLIDAADVVDNLTSMCPNGTQTESGDLQMCPNGTQTESDDLQMCPNGTQTESGDLQMCPNRTEGENQNLRTNGTQILPTSERQIRPLTKLKPEQQRKVWQQAVQVSGGKVPSGATVKDIVQRIMEKTKVPNPYRVGEVCQIIPSYNPDLRGKGGCWCIVSHVGDFSCTVMAWDREYIVRIDHLKLLEYTDAECEQMKKICDRLKTLLALENLEPVALGILSSLGELKRPYLTPFEEKLLQLIELEYGV
jgi:hypothetical protein